jgi:amidase
MPTRREILIAAPSLAAQPALPELCRLSARDLKSLLRARKISARELLEAHLGHIERVNPKVNAIVTLAPELARAAAGRADDAIAQGKPLGPLHGLPIAHKDLVDTKAIRTTYGSPLFRNHVPEENDMLVDRMQAAGAITIGKTNTPEFGAGSQTFNPVFGPTRNPYELTRTCGGSSGGAAVALACRMLPLADGSDMGGSLRNPAAWCNVVGFRPSAGRVPAPKAAFAWSNLSTAGPMARSVSDLALLLSVLAGPHPDAPLSLPEPGSDFDRPLDRSWKGVRIAWFNDLNGTPFDPLITAKINAQRKIFESLGCIVEEAEPDFTGADFAFKTLRAWNTAHQHGAQIRENRSAYKDTIVEEAERGMRLSSRDLARAETLRGQIWRRFQQFLRSYEFFVLPVTQVPPFDLNLPYPREINGVALGNYIDWMKACWFISITGNPAISVPCGFLPGAAAGPGLPTGLQIAGRHNADLSVLQLAHAFEQATQHGGTLPPVL